MTDNSGNLAALIGSRICHDLISPIGAISNGLELLELAGAAQSPELDLIGESVSNAEARIRFFRIAYGFASDQMIGPAEVTPILNSLNKSGRLDMVWHIDQAVPRNLVRLAFLAFQCCESAMPLGGTVIAKPSDNSIVIEANAEKFNIDQELWSLINAPTGSIDIAPAHVQFALLPVTARDSGRSVQVDLTDNRLAITI